MQPISRETILDRREATIRWSAVFAGAIAAGGLWLLLQLLFTGSALATINANAVDQATGTVWATTFGSLLAPLLAMFLGGLLAGRLANHYDRNLAGLHGAMVWALSAVVGTVLMGAVLSSIVTKPSATALATDAPAPGSMEYLDRLTVPVSRTLVIQGAPAISTNDVIAASRTAVLANGDVDRDTFTANLDQQTNLSRPEAEAAVTAFGASAPDVITTAHRVALHREDALAMAKTGGKTMLGAGLALLVGLISAIGGAVLGRRTVVRPVAITAQYPVLTPEA